MMGYGFGGGIAGGILGSLSILLHMAMPVIIIVGILWLLVGFGKRNKKDHSAADKDTLYILRER